MKNSKKHILVAEDDPGIIEVVEIVLNEGGYIPHSAKSFKEILSIIDKHPINMIFLDVLLSGENGGEIAKALKKNPDTKNIPVLLLSANMSIAKLASDSGADGYLQKPFDLDDFLDVIKKHTK